MIRSGTPPLGCWVDARLEQQEGVAREVRALAVRCIGKVGEQPRGIKLTGKCKTCLRLGCGRSVGIRGGDHPIRGVLEPLSIGTEYSEPQVLLEGRHVEMVVLIGHVEPRSALSRRG